MDKDRVAKKLIQVIKRQPQAWQVLWTDCGMPQPASEFKVLLADMVDQKQIDFKVIAGSRYYFNR